MYSTDKVRNNATASAACLPVQDNDNNGGGSFHHIRRQHKEEVQAEINAKILEESLELNKREEDRDRPALRQDDAISILSYLFQWGGPLIEKVRD